MRYDNKNLIIRDNGDFNLFDPFIDDFFGFRFPKHEFKELNKMMLTDIKEKEKSFELEIDMPGFKKEDISMDLSEGYLTISAKKVETNDEKDKSGNYIRRERKCGTSSRTFYVGNIKEESIDAKLEHGVLQIIIPKAELEAPNKKRIEIK